MDLWDFTIRWLNLPRTPPRGLVNWLYSSFETKVRVGVFECPRASRPMARLPVRVVSIGPNVRVALWTMVSFLPVITESWDSSAILGLVMCLVADIAGNIFVPNGTGFGGYLIMLSKLT